MWMRRLFLATMLASSPWLGCSDKDKDVGMPADDGSAGMPAEGGADVPAESGADGNDGSLEAAPSAEASTTDSSPSPLEADVASDAGTTVMDDPTAFLARQSPSCVDCAFAGCATYVEGCATLSDRATEGPAAGTIKSELCTETLACVLASSCASPCLDSMPGCAPFLTTGTCYCGPGFDDPNVQVVPQYCDPPTGNYAGSCAKVFQRSFETTSTSVLLSRLTDLSKGGGWAMQLLQCLADNRCASCFPPPSSDGGADGGD